jgi:uncharacterized protein (DUF1684 family)
MNPEALLEHRAEKDEFFRTSAYSPLTPAQQAAFDGLRYYPPNEALDLVVTVERSPRDASVAIEMTNGETQTYQRYGRFTFEVNGQPAALTIYAGPHGYFLPFADANAGGDTYGAGRYLEPEALGNDRFSVDFNLAYSPYCAYGPGWSCPITPAENRLDVAIEAGEMTPQGDWLDAE